MTTFQLLSGTPATIRLNLNEWVTFDRPGLYRLTVTSHRVSDLGAKSQDALWRRYEAWSLQWRGRESELRYIHGEENPNAWEVGLGQALATALATGQAWVADDGMVRRTLDLAVGQQMRQQIESAISTRPPPRR